MAGRRTRGTISPRSPAALAGTRVLVIGHVATRWAFDHLIDGIPLEELTEADFDWREGWEYEIERVKTRER